MKNGRRIRGACLSAIAAFASLAAQGHSASDAYLTLTALAQSKVSGAARTVLQGQWDIALRDLDFVLKLDDNGDGKIVWGELRQHQQAIAEYAYAHVQFMGNGKVCRIEPTRQAVDYHADGAYAALFFDVVCSAAVKQMTLDYRMFFKIDPSHRGILVLRSGDKIATSVLSPENSSIEVGL
jgi:hypothetical protein